MAMTDRIDAIKARLAAAKGPAMSEWASKRAMAFACVKVQGLCPHGSNACRRLDLCEMEVDAVAALRDAHRKGKADGIRLAVDRLPPPMAEAVAGPLLALADQIERWEEASDGE